MRAKIRFLTGLLLGLGMQKGLSQNLVKPDGNSTSHKQGARDRFIHSGKAALKVDYFGELALHPGLCLGVGYSLAQKGWVTVHWDTELGGYWHKWNNSALFLKTSIGTRFPVRSMFVDVNLGAGYMHAFASGTIYQKSSEGGIEKAPNWGHPHFMPNASFLIGWSGDRKKKLPWSFYVGTEVYLQSSFNHIFLPHAAAKVGFTYKFKK